MRRLNDPIAYKIHASLISGELTHSSSEASIWYIIFLLLLKAHSVFNYISHAWNWKTVYTMQLNYYISRPVSLFHLSTIKFGSTKEKSKKFLVIPLCIIHKRIEKAYISLYWRIGGPKELVDILVMIWIYSCEFFCDVLDWIFIFMKKEYFCSYIYADPLFSYKFRTMLCISI